MLAMNFMGVCFMLLTYERGMIFASSVNYFIFILIIILFVIFRFGGIPRKAAKLEEKFKVTADKKEK